MARAPFAEWRPVPTAASEPQITATQLIYHTAVGTLPGTDAYFRSGRSGGVESHFGVGGPWEGAQYDGVIYQWVDTARQADANREANARAISIETSDGGNPDRPWTPKQLDALIRLGRWAHDIHGIPLRIIPSPYAAGYGFHAMWLNTRFEYPDGSTPFTPSPGKVCPGAVRIRQLRETVLPRVFAGTEEADMTDDQAQRLANIEKLVQRLVNAALTKDPAGNEVDEAVLAYRRLRAGSSSPSTSQANLENITERLVKLEQLVTPEPPA